MIDTKKHTMELTFTGFRCANKEEIIGQTNSSIITRRLLIADGVNQEEDRIRLRKYKITDLLDTTSSCDNDCIEVTNSVLETMLQELKKES